MGVVGTEFSHVFDGNEKERYTKCDSVTIQYNNKGNKPFYSIVLYLSYYPLEVKYGLRGGVPKCTLLLRQAAPMLPYLSDLPPRACCFTLLRIPLRRLKAAPAPSPSSIACSSSADR